MLPAQISLTLEHLFPTPTSSKLEGALDAPFFCLARPPRTRLCAQTFLPDIMPHVLPNTGTCLKGQVRLVEKEPGQTRQSSFIKLCQAAA